MNLKNLAIGTALVMGSMLSGVAFAATLTFEGVSNTIYNSPITRSGFNIGNPVGDEQHFHVIVSLCCGLPSNGTGVLLNDRDTRLFIVEQSALAFALGSFDVATALANYPAVGLTIEGFFHGGSTGIISLASLGSGYTTLNGAVLGSIDRLIFDGIGGGGGFIVDNLTLNPIPEPETYAMLLAGLGLLGLAARRRKQKVA